MLNPFRKKGEAREARIPQALTIAVWSPVGNNTAKFSLALGKELAQITSVALVELPCLGIPKLGFVSDILDREKCTESALQELEKRGGIDLNQLHHNWANLVVLPASVFATPDYPLINRLAIETLISFPVQFINSARQQGHNTIIFECQGQLTSPMTFFALKNSDLVLLLLDEPDDLALALLNIKRAVQAFKFSLDKFCLVGDIDPAEVAEYIQLKDDEDREMGCLTAVSGSTQQIREMIYPGLNPAGSGNRPKGAWGIFSKSCVNAAGELEETTAETIRL